MSCRRLHDLILRTVPHPVEEPDPAGTLIGYTFQPGTYKGLIVAIAPHTAHVDMMFSKGIERLDTDDGGGLEGTGRKTRDLSSATSGATSSGLSSRR